MSNIDEVKVYLLLTNQKFRSLESKLVPHETRNRNKGNNYLEHKINTQKTNVFVTVD